MKTTFRRFAVASFLAFAVISTASAAVITVGVTNGANSIPLGNTNIGGSNIVRYQQVYGASAFNSVTGPMWINSLSFFGPASISAGTYTVTLSTTTKAVSNSPTQGGTGLSLTSLDSNLGSDAVTFFSGAIEDTLKINGSSFLYDWSLGNLLLDIVIHSHTPNGAFFDAATFTNDQVSRVWSTTGNTAANEAARARSVGLVTQFDYSATAPVPVPEPASLVLLLGGLGALGFMRRKRILQQ